MRTLTPHPRRPPYAARSSSAIVLVLACAFGMEARGSSLSTASPFDAESHALACHCGTKCRGDSCCCGTAETQPVAAPSPPASPVSKIDDSPCLASAPCHDPLVPPSTPTGASEKAASTIEASPSPARIGRRLALSRSPRIPSDRRGSRLDRPPRVAPLA